MKVIIAGSRHFTNYYQLLTFVDQFRTNHEITEVVSGCMDGADKLGELYARVHNIPITPFPAHWDKYGKKAGPLRNQQMVDYADALIAFPASDSKGTYDCIRRAHHKGLPIYICSV